MEAEPENLPFFFAVASALKKKGGPPGLANAVSWLRFLADYEAERGDSDRQIAVLLEIARMSPSDPQIRGEIDAALRKIHAGHPALATVFAKFSLATAADLSETAGKIARWLRFSPGGIYRMPGRGAGRIAELNPALDVIRMDFSDAKLPLSLVNAEKNLTPLPPEHLLRRKLEDPHGTRALAEREPAETVRLLLESFGRPMTLVEVKENLAGIVDEARWGSFWTAARKNKRIVASGNRQDGDGRMVGKRRWGGGLRPPRVRVGDARAERSKSPASRRSGRRTGQVLRRVARGEARGAAARERRRWRGALAAALKLAPSQPRLTRRPSFFRPVMSRS
jgi:transcription elongation factor GreA-like protein